MICKQRIDSFESLNICRFKHFSTSKSTDLIQFEILAKKRTCDNRRFKRRIIFCGTNKIRCFSFKEAREVFRKIFRDGRYCGIECSPALLICRTTSNHQRHVSFGARCCAFLRETLIEHKLRTCTLTNSVWDKQFSSAIALFLSHASEPLQSSSTKYSFSLQPVFIKGQ